jgi:hypothetical protein
VRWFVVLPVWAGLLTIHTIVLIALGGDGLEVFLLGGAAAGVVVLAALMAVRRDGEAPDTSPAAVLAALAVAGLVLGTELGLWLVLISLGVLALAGFRLLREGVRW